MSNLSIAFVAVAVFSFFAGIQWANRGHEQAVINQQKSDIAAIKEIEKQADELKQANQPIIEVINAAQNDCLDQPYPADIQRGLRQAYDRATR